MSAAGRTSNFLISVRCVKPEDKSISMGMSLTILSIFAFIPAPILFGWIIDQTCLVWGKTCSGTGNCWLYDVGQFRFYLNFVAMIAVLCGTFCDCGVWYLVKNLQIFDDDISNLNKDDKNNKLDDNVLVNNDKVIVENNEK